MFTPTCGTVFLLTLEGMGSEIKLWEKWLELVCPNVTEESARLQEDILTGHGVWHSELGLCPLALSTVMVTSDTFDVLAI